VSDSTTTSCAKVKLKRIRPIITRTILVLPKIKRRYDRIMATCPILKSTLLVMNLLSIGYSGAVEIPIVVATAPAIQNSFGLSRTYLKK